MIVIAIIGILAVSLFPSLTAYLKRSRDASRAANLKDISNAIGAYYTDEERYPIGTNGCVTVTLIGTGYMDGRVPSDPTTWRDNGCGANGSYGYASGTGYSNSQQFILTSIFESQNGWNYSINTSTGVSGLVWTGVFYFSARTMLDGVWVVKKWNGSGYLFIK